MWPQGSLSRSQELSNNYCPETDESSLRPSIVLLPNSFKHETPTYFLVIREVLFLSRSPPKPRMPFSFPHTCHMARQSHYPHYYLPNYIWWGSRAMEPVITQFFFQSSVTFSHLDSNIFFRTLVSKTLSWCSSVTQCEVWANSVL